jgi:hypothetical protein
VKRKFGFLENIIKSLTQVFSLKNLALSNNINCVQISDLVTNNKNEKFFVCEKCDDNLEEYMKKRK